MSIHADDEFNLRLALDSELDDVTPHAGLADLVIARYRKGRRRRFAGVVGLFVVFVGIGVPAGIASTSGGAPDAGWSGPAPPRLVHADAARPVSPQDAKTAPCATGAGAARETAAVASGVCVLMFFMPPAVTGAGRPGRAARRQGGHRRPLPGLARAARLRARPGDGTALVIEGDSRDLVIGASGLSRSALVSLVSTGLSAA